MKRLNRAFIAAFNNLTGGYKEDGSRFFSDVDSENTIGNMGDVYLM